VKEQGVVTKVVSGNIVEVAFQRSKACEKCGLCHDMSEGMVGIEAVNEVGARLQDIVEIDIPSKELVKGSIMVFFVPILLLFVGYLAGSKISGGIELFSIGSAIIFFIVSFFAIRWYDMHVQQKEALRAKIIRRVS
jgi:sigma-E factor negative regulatory protein RseC